MLCMSTALRVSVQGVRGGDVNRPALKAKAGRWERVWPERGPAGIDDARCWAGRYGRDAGMEIV